jgi:hypothetical protein
MPAERDLGQRFDLQKSGEIRAFIRVIRVVPCFSFFIAD